VLVSPSSLPCPAFLGHAGIITSHHQVRPSSECLSRTLEAIDTWPHIEDRRFLTRRFPATINVPHVRNRNRPSALQTSPCDWACISRCANVSTRQACIAHPACRAVRSVTKRNRDCPSSPCKLLTTLAASPLRGGLSFKTTSSPAHKKSGSLR
jgi:hypothetical protein